MDSVLEHALMAASAYQFARSGANRLLPPQTTGWAEVIEFYERDQQTGFEAKVFHRPETDEYVIAFTGTDEWRDWVKSNFPAYLGFLPESLRQALALYARVVAEHPGAKVSFTGHSLGGGLAALMGVYFGCEALSFDQAPFRAAASEANRDKLLALLDSLIAEPGRTPAASAALGGLRAKLAAFDAATLAVREGLVTDYSVEGEILSTGSFAASRIGRQAPLLAHGARGVRGTDLHGIARTARNAPLSDHSKAAWRPRHPAESTSRRGANRPHFRR